MSRARHFDAKPVAEKRHFDAKPVAEKIEILEHRLESWKAPLPEWLAVLAPKTIAEIEQWIERLKASQ